MNSKVIVMTTAVIESIIFNNRLQQEFPFIAFAYKNWNKASGGRSCCGKGMDTSQRSYYLTTVKNSIAILPPERIKVLKEILDVGTLIVYADNLKREL